MVAYSGYRSVTISSPAPLAWNAQNRGPGRLGRPLQRMLQGTNTTKAGVMVCRDYGLTKDVPVLHASGGLKHQPVWNQMVNQFLVDSRLRDIAAPSRPDLETVIINTRPESSLLERVLYQIGVRDHETGFGLSPWRWWMKLVLLQSYLRISQKPYVLYLDASDILLFTDPSVLLERFCGYGCKLLFMAESTAWPGGYHELEARERAIAEQEGCLPYFRFLNSGAFIGRADYLLSMLDSIDIGDERFHRERFGWDTPSERDDGKVLDDQLTCRYMYSENYPDIKLDYRADLFIRFDTRMIAHVTDAAEAEAMRPDNEITWW
jgi:hypothetical protein